MNKLIVFGFLAQLLILAPSSFAKDCDLKDLQNKIAQTIMSQHGFEGDENYVPGTLKIARMPETHHSSMDVEKDHVAAGVSFSYDTIKKGVKQSYVGQFFFDEGGLNYGEGTCKFLAGGETPVDKFEAQTSSH